MKIQFTTINPCLIVSWSFVLLIWDIGICAAYNWTIVNDTSFVPTSEIETEISIDKIYHIINTINQGKVTIRDLKFFCSDSWTESFILVHLW